VFRPYALTISLVAGCLLLTPAGAFAAAKPQVAIVANCAGDTVSGNVAVRASTAMPFTLRLLQRRQAQSRWVPTGRTRSFTSLAGRRRHRFSFDVSSFDAHAYRVAVEGRRGRLQYRALSRVIPATACAPGHDVPEAPLALLLPLSLLATGSLVMLLRRRVLA
jgi:hypothetical protein